MAEFKPNFLNPSENQSAAPAYDGRPVAPGLAASAEEVNLANFNQPIGLPDERGGFDTLDLGKNQAELDRMALESEVRFDPEDAPLTLKQLKAYQAQERQRIYAEVYAQMQAELKEQLKPRNLVEAARTGAVNKLKSFVGNLRAGWAAKRERRNDQLAAGFEKSKQTLKSLWSGLLRKTSQVAERAADVAAGVAAQGVNVGVAAGNFTQEKVQVAGEKAQAAREQVAQKAQAAGEKLGAVRENAVQKSRESYEAVSDRVREVSWNLANKKFEIIGGLEHGVRRYVRLEADLQTLDGSIRDVQANIRMADQELKDIREDEISDAKQAGEIAFIQSRKAEYLKELSTRLQEREELQEEIASLNLQARIDRAKDLYDKIEQNNPGYLKGEGQDSKLVRVMQEAMSLIGKVNAAEMDAALEDVATTEPVVSEEELEKFTFQDLGGESVPNEADILPTVEPDEILDPAPSEPDYAPQPDDIEAEWTSTDVSDQVDEPTDPKPPESTSETVSRPEGQLLSADTIYDFAEHGLAIGQGDSLVLRYGGERPEPSLRLTRDENGNFRADQSLTEVGSEDKQVKQNGEWVTKRYVFLRQSDTAPLLTLQLTKGAAGFEPESIHVEASQATQTYLSFDKAAVRTENRITPEQVEVSQEPELQPLAYGDEPVTLEKGRVLQPRLQDGDSLKIAHPTIPALQIFALSGGHLDTTPIDKDFAGEYLNKEGQTVTTYRVRPHETGPLLHLELVDGRVSSLEVSPETTDDLAGWTVEVR